MGDVFFSLAAVSKSSQGIPKKSGVIVGFSNLYLSSNLWLSLFSPVTPLSWPSLIKTPTGGILILRGKSFPLNKQTWSCLCLLASHSAMINGFGTSLKMGNTQFRSAYHSILNSSTCFLDFHPVGSSSSGLNPIWKKLWQLKVLGRIFHLAWCFFINSLPSPCNLARWNLPFNYSCLLYRYADSTNSHIFFLCPFATQV